MSKHRVADKTYEDGLSDAWEAARKIVCDIGCSGFDAEQLADIFEISDPLTIMADYTAQQAIYMIQAHEDRKEIKRGDEVEYNTFSAPHNKTLGIIISVDTDSVLVMGKGNCNTAWLGKESVTRTGRNFAAQLDALLGEIGGDTD